MNEWSYVRGPYPAILRENTLIAIAGEGAEASARELLSITTGQTPLEEVIDVLIAGGLADAPDFFVGRLVEGSLSAFVRGAAVVTVEDDRWNHSSVTGEHARTWREVAIDGVTRLAVGFAPSHRADLLSVQDDEREARPGPLGISEVVFRAPQPMTPLLTVTGPPPARQTLEFDDAFPDDLFAPPAEDSPTANVSDDNPTDEIPGLGSRFDDLFGATRFVGVESAAVRREEAEDAGPASSAAGPSPVTTPLAAAPPLPAPPIETPLPPAPPAAALPGLVCPSGHPNPPMRDTCAVCGAHLTAADLAAVAQPSLGTVALPDGRRIPIAENMIIGRSPRSERTAGSRLPTLVKIEGAPGDVSRNHARVFVEGWNVLVEDLGSTNGTMVIATNGTARRLRSGETALLGRGTVLDLGGVRLLLEDVP